MSAGGSSGTAVTSIPIVVPPFHGLEPSLALSYNSGAGNGWVGVGWALTGLSGISRVSAAHGVPRFSDDDIFQLDGRDLAPCAPTQGQPGQVAASCRYPAPAAKSPGCISGSGYQYSYYTTRADSGLVICRASSLRDPLLDQWTVTAKDGTRTQFEPAITSHGVVTFVVASTRDLRGNEVDFSWSPPGDQPSETPVLAEIDYNHVRIRFFDEPRPDVVSAATSGGTTRLTRRLKTILITVSEKGGGKVVEKVARAYALTYSQSPDSGRSVLAREQEYGTDAKVDAAGTVTGSSLPPQTFTTDSGAPTGPWSVATASSSPSNIPPANGFSVTSQTDVKDYHGDFRLGDFTGTGKTGVVFREEPQSDDKCPGTFTFVTMPTTGGPGVRSVLEDSTDPNGGGDTCGNYTEWWALDMNGDGLADLAFLVDTASGEEIAVYLNDGGGTFSYTPIVSLPTPYSDGVYGTCATGDVTGNHHMAVVCLLGDYSGDREQLTTYQLDLNGDLESVTSPPLTGLDEYRWSTIRLGDVNGDGRADVILPMPGPYNEWAPTASGMQTLLSQGNGSFGPPIPSPLPANVAASWQDPESWSELGDLNGDGLADFTAITYPKIGIGDPSDPNPVFSGSATIISAISTGDGHWRFNTQPVPDFITEKADPHQGLSGSLSDFEGDGSTGFTTVFHNLRCANVIPNDHMEVLRARSNGDGTFAWPTSKDDCSTTQGVNIDLSSSFWDTLVSFFGNEDDGQFPALGDADGDGTADTILVNGLPGQQETPQLVTVFAPPRPVIPAAGWQPADVAGDGSTGFVHVDSGAPLSGPLVETITPRRQTFFCIKHPQFPQCTPYAFTTEVLTTFPDPGDPFPLHATLGDGWRVLDLTGAGRPSLVYIDSSGYNYFPGVPFPQPATLVLTYLPAAGGGWAVTPVVSWFHRQAAGSQAAGSIGPWLAADVAGDGRTGLLAVELTSNLMVVDALTPQPDGHWTDDRRSMRRPEGVDGSWRALDVNGDRRTDLVNIRMSHGRLSLLTLINNGPGSDWTPVATPWVQLPGADGDLSSWLTGDFTGDGTSDLAHIQQDGNDLHVSVLASRGDGTWVRQPTVDIPLAPAVAGLPQNHWMAFDTNGDDKADLIHLAPSSQAAGPSATGVIAAVYRSTDDISFAAADPVTLNAPAAKSYDWLPVQASGDGVTDLGMVTFGDGYKINLITTSHRADRLVGVDNGLGGTATLTYQPSNFWRVNSDSTAGCGWPDGVGAVAVASLTVDSGTGTPSTQTYDYSCPQWSPELHRILGWHNTTSRRAASPSTDGAVVTTVHALDAVCGDQILDQTTADASGGPILTSTQYSYPPHDTQPSASCRPASSTTRQCDPAENCPTQLEAYTYDEYGNVIRRLQQATATDGTQLLDRTISTTYQYSLDPYLVDLPQSSTLTSSTAKPPVVTEQKFCYDHDCAGPARVPRGLLTDVTDVNVTDPAASRHTSYGYDDAGNRTSVTDANKHTTTTIYDPQEHVYPQTTTDGLGHRTTKSWDVALGVPTAVTDPDHLTTHMTYDPMGRLTDTRLPSGTVSHIRYRYFGDLAHQSVRTCTDDSSADGICTNSNSADGIWTETRFDGLGRTIFVTRKGDSPDRNETTLTTYADSSQRVFTQSHWAISSAIAAAPVETYHYDALGRPVSQTHPDEHASRTTTRYLPAPQGSEVIRSNETGHLTYLGYDAWGRQTSVRQPVKGKLATLSYGYDAADDLTSITDDAGNTTIRTWNSLGEMTSEQDPDRGTTTFTYDPAGNLHTVTDARKITATYRYDAVNRLIRKHVTGVRQATVWHYDQPGHGPSVGLLTSVSDPSATGCPHGISENQTYDTAGRPSTLSTCVAGRAASFTTRYDKFGRQKATIYPDGQTVAMRYGRSGRAHQHRPVRNRRHLRPLGKPDRPDPG